MSLNWPKPGLNNVPSYLVSGIPYVTRSAVDEVPSHGVDNYIKVSFPFVTRFFHVACDSSSTGNLRFAFTENGLLDPTGSYSATGNVRNYFSLRKGEETPRLDIRCTDIYFAGDAGVSTFEVVAGMTNIPRDQMGFLTGSNGFEGVG